MNRIPLAFIGGSIYSAVGNAHRIASQLDACFSVEAGCFSRNQEVNLATAHTWGVNDTRVHNDWKSLIDDEELRDMVLVLLTPTPSHYEILRYALGKNRTVISEKSITSNAAQAALIEEMTNSKQGKLYAVYNYTGYPMVRELKELVQEGELGEVLHCEIDMQQEGFLRRDPEGSAILPQQWRQVDDFIPTVALDLGIHVVNLFRFIFGVNISAVLATYQSRGNVPNVVDHVDVLGESQSDVNIRMSFGKTSLGKSNGLAIHIYGSRMSASWTQTDPEYLLLHDSQGHSTQVHRGSTQSRIASAGRYNRFKAGHPSGFLEAFANHYSDLADAITNDVKASPYVFTARDAVVDMQVLEAISRSVISKEWQQL